MEKERTSPWLILFRVVFTAALIACIMFIFRNSLENGAQSSARSQAVMQLVNSALAKVHLGPLSEHLIRKLAHFSEFALEGFLLMLCIRVYTKHFVRHMSWPLLGGMTTALMDETTTTLFSLFSGEGPLDKAIQSIVSLQGFAFVLYLSGVLLLGYLMACLIGRIFRHWYCDLSHDTKSVSLQGAYSFAQKGIIGALIARERHRYFSIPVYVINTALGYMMAAIFVIFAVVIKEDVAAQIYQFGGLFQIPYSSGEMLYVYALAIMVSLSCTTFPSISIEGKNMELIKSMPISIFEFIKAKLLFHLSLSIPVTLVLNTVLAFGLHLQWAAILSGYLLPLVFSAFIGVAGCIANLLFPSFDWENATYIVKRSIPAILNALMSMALSCGGFYILIKHFPKHLFVGNVIVCIIVTILTTAAVSWLKVKGEILYRKL